MDETMTTRRGAGSATASTGRVGTLVVGAGVAGMCAAHELSRVGEDFAVIDAATRIGDSWRERYDSLRLFSTRHYASLPGDRMPIGRRDCPTRDEFADYLADHARRTRVPVQLGRRVTRVVRDGDGFLVRWTGAPGAADAGEKGELHAPRLIVAVGAHARRIEPPFADLLDPSIRSLHSTQYRGPRDLAAGPVLVVGAGNSGTDIALEAAAHGHPTVLAGRHPGQLPLDIDTIGGFVLSHVILFAMRRVLTVRSRRGRAVRDAMRGHGLMLIRNRLADLDAAGIVRVGRIAGVRDGRPFTAEGAVDAATVVWCTGSRPELSWLDVEGALDADGEPVHDRGVGVRGIGYVGLDFQYSAASGTIQGMPQDARSVVRRLLAAR